MRSQTTRPPAGARRGPGNCVLRIQFTAERETFLTRNLYPICGRIESALAILERACGLRITAQDLR